MKAAKFGFSWYTHSSYLVRANEHSPLIGSSVISIAELCFILFSIDKIVYWIMPLVPNIYGKSETLRICRVTKQ